MEFWSRRAPAILAVAAIWLTAGCTSNAAVEPAPDGPDGLVLSKVACERLRVVEANRSRDVTDPDAVRELVEVLSHELLAEAALFYYPYGGSVAGLDTSGTNAERAGRVLEASLHMCK